MARTSQLFSSLRLREVEFRNRVWVSPMCQYSSRDGIANQWHLVHLGSRAVGGAGLVVVEATSVSPEGRISPGDLGIWSQEHVEAFVPIVEFIKAQGAAAGVQVAHAGRKASTSAPWLGGGGPVGPSEGGWQVIAPSALAFDADHPVPREMTHADIDMVVEQFEGGVRRALAAGFDVVELHMAHGYLMHEFLSPLSNHRDDEYGGDLEGRMRLPLRVANAAREAWPASKPLFVRISATDWVEGGWDLEQSIAFARRLKELGVDLIDCSSGGAVPKAHIPAGPGYQTPLSAAIRAQAHIPTVAVGFITEPFQAEQTLVTGQADAVFLARELLRDPYWPLHAAEDLGISIPWPVQYERAKVR